MQNKPSANMPKLSASVLKSLEKEHWIGFPLPSPDSSVSAADFSPYALSSISSSPRVEPRTRSSSISPISVSLNATLRQHARRAAAACLQMSPPTVLLQQLSAHTTSRHPHHFATTPMSMCMSIHPPTPSSLSSTAHDIVARETACQVQGVATSLRATTRSEHGLQCATEMTPHTVMGQSHHISALQSNSNRHEQRLATFVSPNKSMKRKRATEVCPHDQHSVNLEQVRAPHSSLCVKREQGEALNILDSPLSSTAEHDMEMQPSPLKRRRFLAQSIADDTVAVDIGDGHRSHILHRVVDHLYTAILRASVSDPHCGSAQKDVFADATLFTKTTYGDVSVFLQRLVNLFWGTAPALTVTSLILLKRFLRMSHLTLHRRNWRGLIQTAYLVAHKMLEDESYTNLVYAGAMKHCTVNHLNTMEIKFMEVIKFDAYVKPSLFNKFAQAVLSNEPIPSAYDVAPSVYTTSTRKYGNLAPLPFSAQMPNVPTSTSHINNRPISSIRVPAFQPDTPYTCVPVYPNVSTCVPAFPNVSVPNHVSTRVRHAPSHADAPALAPVVDNLDIVSHLLEEQVNNVGARMRLPAQLAAGAQHLQGLPMSISTASHAHQSALLELYKHAARHCGLSAAMQMNLNPYIAAGQ